ncbi:MAG TPA: YceI family protein [Planctomycetota bacterium]|nr:YceI family protein [Planctomycetota bacterium]
MKKSLWIALLMVAGCGEQPSSSSTSSTASSSASTASTSDAAGAAKIELPKSKMTYYFGANPARTIIKFESKTNVTNIVGKSNMISGEATIDFGAGDGACHLVVPAASLDSGMADRDNAMRGKGWLDVKQFPTIEFKSEKARFTPPSTWTIDGQFLLKGKSQPMTVTADVVPFSEATGKALGEGQWVKIRTDFKVDITKHDIKIDQSAQFTVEPIWSVSIILFGTTAKPAGAPVVKTEDPGDEMIKIVRVAPVSPENLPGKTYRLGKKTQFATLTATSETELEVVTAQTSAIAGWIGYDKDKGVAGVRMRIPVAHLKTGIEDRDKKMLSEQWLDAEKHKDILFESTKATKKDGETWTLDGTLTIRGSARPISIDVAVKEISAEDVKKARWGDAPGLQATTSFKVKLSDHGIKIPEISAGKVNDTWTIKAFLVGLEEQP